ncbi:MAG: BatA domain-containing protein [Phycisphaerales bacterium]
MTFANPILFALGAAFVALPIILHFLKRKRKPVMWGAMRFLIEAYRRKRRRMTLEQLLLLLTRCALVLLFALAIGQPIFGGSGTQSGPRELYIVLDDSIASANKSGDATDFESHKERAISLLDTLTPEAGDRAGLVLASSPSRGVITPASSDIAAVRRAIERAERTDAAADLEGAFNLIGEAITTDDENAPAVTVAVVSGLREGSVVPDRPLPRLSSDSRRVSVIAADPASEPVINYAIAGIEPLRNVVLGEAERDGQATVIVERSGAGIGESASVPVSLAIEGTNDPASGQAEFEPGQTSAELMLSFAMPSADVSRTPTLVASLPSDSNDADNTVITPIDRRSVLRVGVIASRPLVGQVGIDRFTPADWIRLALSPGETTGELRIVDTTPSLLDAPRLATLDAVFLLEPDELTDGGWSMLRRFVDRGGLLVVTPPAKDSVQLWTDSMTETLGLRWSISREPIAVTSDARIDTDSRAPSDKLLAMIAGELDQLSSGVSFNKLLPLIPEQDDDPSILKLTDGSTLLAAARPETVTGRVSTGLVVYLASPTSLDWTDLPTRPLMVPLVQELIRQGIGLATDRALRTAGDASTQAPAAPEIVNSEGDPVEAPIRRAGRYELRDEAGEVSGVLAVLPDVRGSRAGAMTQAALEPWLAATAGGSERLTWIDAEGAMVGASTTTTSTNARGESRLLFWLIVFALVCAVLETVLARWSARSMQAQHMPEAHA